LLFEWRRQLREGMMPGVSHPSAESPGARFAPVRLVEETSMTAAASRPATPRLAARPRAAVPSIELALRNGRVLRAAETIAPETLGRLAAALDA
jgi:transposase